GKSNRDVSIPGAESFDAFQAHFSWIFGEQKQGSENNILKRDEWGCLHSIPKDGAYAYLIKEEPLSDWANHNNYKFPNPADADKYFEKIQKSVEPISDRFMVGYLDPGPFLIAINMRGFENILMDIVTDIGKAQFIFDGIVEYQENIIEKWAALGAHQINFFDEWASHQTMLVPPENWDRYFKPYYRRLFDKIHDLGMYAGIGLDGATLPILPGLIEAGLDVFDVRQFHVMGIKNLAKLKVCIKACVDMQTTLVNGTPDEIEAETGELVDKLGSRSGGYIALVGRSRAMNYKEESIAAAVKGFNRFRKPALI
ncbi:MAG: uroporphyrinogen decarboxylase family protein, partial [bacterium]